MKAIHAFIGAAISFVVGVGLILVKHLGSAPTVSCVKSGQPTSGFAITKDGKDCPLSSADFKKYWDWDNNSAVHLHQLGALLVLVALILLIIGIVKSIRGKKRLQQPV